MWLRCRRPPSAPPRAASAAYERASRLEPASAEVAYHHASYLRSFGDLLRARQMLSDAALVQASAQPNHLTCNPDLPVQTRTRTRPHRRWHEPAPNCE